MKRKAFAWKENKQRERIARERIFSLFDMAGKAFEKRPEYSHRYIQLARKIAMRYNIRMPKSLKRRFCKRCYSYLVPGKNSQVRTRAMQKAVIVKCLECGNIMRYSTKKVKNA